MKENLNKIITVLALLLSATTIAYASNPVTYPANGGTGWGTPGGLQAGNVLIGNGLSPLATSSGLTFNSSAVRLTVTYASSTAQTITTLFSTSATTSSLGILNVTNGLLYTGNGGNVLGVATTSPSQGTGITLSGIGTVVGGSLSITNSGVISGNCTAPVSCSGTNPLAITTQPGTFAGSGLYNFPLNVAAASTTPWAYFAVNPTAGVAANQFLVGSSTATAFVINNAGNVGIASTTPNFTLSVNNAGSDFYVKSTGEVVGVDQTNAWPGRINPTQHLTETTATTTSWTASTSDPYVPYAVAPFSGSLKQMYCFATSSQAFLGIQPFINTTITAPSYFVASNTVGIIKFTGSNTFVRGDRIGFFAGTTTSDLNAKGVSCTFDAVETP